MESEAYYVGPRAPGVTANQPVGSHSREPVAAWGPGQRETTEKRRRSQDWVVGSVGLGIILQEHFSDEITTTSELTYG